jgi:hypothetical protein
LPTTGLTSGDVGLEALDRGQRTRKSTGTLFPSADVDPATRAQYSFGARDNALRDSAVDSVTGIRPDGADPNLFVERAGEITDARRDVAQRGVDQAQGAQRGVEIGRRGPAEDLNAFEGQGAGASRNIDDMYRETRRAEIDQSRNLFSSIDPGGAVQRDVAPLTERARLIQESVAGLPERIQNDLIPHTLLDDIRALAPEIETRTITSPLLDQGGRPITRAEEVNTGGTGQMSFRDMNRMRPALSAAEQRARDAPLQTTFVL